MSSKPDPALIKAITRANDLSGRLAVGELALNFAKACVVNMFHWGTAVTNGFWFGKSTACAEDAKELSGFTIDLAEDF